MQNCENLVDLEKRCKMSIWSQKSALIQLRTSLLKFDYLADKSEKSSVSNFSTKVTRPWCLRSLEPARTCGLCGPCAPARGPALAALRSPLYQRRFLRPNTHFAAFFEFYKILHLCTARNSDILKLFVHIL